MQSTATLADSYPLNKVIEVMKPCKVDVNKKPSHKEAIEKAFESPLYVAEPKIDGCHYISIGGRFFSTSTSTSKRHGVPLEKTGYFPHLVEGLMRAGLGNIVLDGEINFPGKKSYDVTTVTGCLEDEAIRRQESSGWLYYMIFDILRDTKGNWLFNTPWRERRELLEQVSGKLTQACKYLEVIPVIRSRKRQFLENELAEGREGIILKHVNGTYVLGKRPMWNWIKLKIETADDVVIIGYDPPTKEYKGKEFSTWPYWRDGEPVSKNYYMDWIGSIVFGKYNAAGELIPLGTCVGMDEEMRREFSENGNEYIGRVIKIKAMERTPEGRFRHPSFDGFHPDKNPKECALIGG